jgi:MoaA/NifB/PqqE/SkfB family radical SAM enzyme
MISLIPKIPLYKMFRGTGWPKMLPLNLTLNVTYHCPSRCQTCNVWKKNASELTLDEWEKIFKKMSHSPFWLILSGGEPFSRKDLPELSKLAYRYMKPKVIGIPTNGFLSDIIPGAVEKILENCPKSQLVINFSLDGIAELHDEIRRLSGSFENMLKSYRALKKIKNPRLTIGIHSVISKLNFEKIPEIYEFVRKELAPDSYITEIAEKRTELDNKELEVFPDEAEYGKAIDFLLGEMEKNKFKGFSRITQALRISYYNLVKETLKRKTQVIPCYAGFASGQISADGEIWSCCVRGESMGNLRQHEYDFRKVWFGEKAKTIRNSIKNKECYCPLASASYTNMLMDSSTLAKISLKIIK